MKKFFSITAILAASVSLASAGDWGKAPIVDKTPIVEDFGCACYAPGFEFSGFVAGLLPEGGSDEIGGGASLSYFFTEAVGIEASYSGVDTDSDFLHVPTVNLVLRAVNTDACFAPYLLVGGGVVTNGHTRGLFDVGAGFDIRFEELNCLGIFADATYNWTEDDEEFVLVRAGVRIPF